MVSTSGNSGIVSQLYQLSIAGYFDYKIQHCQQSYNKAVTKSLTDILADKWDEPAEIKLIKDYVLQKFDEHVAVSIHPQQISIHAPNAAAAAALRLHIYDLQKVVKTGKKLVIRIGV